MSGKDPDASPGRLRDKLPETAKSSGSLNFRECRISAVIYVFT